jgi:SAM-dependent methyltransferase
MPKNNPPDLTKVEQLYSENIRKFGNKAESVGWGTQEKQDLRFFKLLSVIDERSESVSINELGCGYGELIKFCERNGYNISEYDGYDISAEMLVAAKDYLLDYQNIKFHQSSEINTQADYTIASGIFNVKFDLDRLDWEEHIKSTLRNMYEHSDKGISFNLLTKYVDFEAENLYYADPSYFFDFCKRELSEKVNLIHDYPLYEWTLIVKR